MKTNDYRDKDISTIIKNELNFKNFCIKLNDKLEQNYTTVISLLSGKNDEIKVEASLHCIKDKYKDYIGILIIARPIKDKDHLQLTYSISDREFDVICELLSIVVDCKNKSYNILSNFV